MPNYRLKHTFTAGELSPLMNSRADFERYRDGCITLSNMVSTTQGPATRRPGTEFLIDFADLDQHASDKRIRKIPFIFNELQAYVLVFYVHTSGTPVMVVGYTEDDGTSGLIVDATPSCGGAPTDAYPDTLAASPPSITGLVRLTLPATFDIDNFDWAQSADEMWIAQANIRPMLIRREDHECWWAIDIYNQFTSPPAAWVATNYPQKVTFHQQRIAWAATVLERQTVWTSVASDFLDYTGTPVTEDDKAVTFTLDSGTQNRIQWMTSLKTLNVGTLANEWTVAGGYVNGALTPEDVFAQRHTNNGSEPNKPLLIGLTTLFVERHGRTINEFVYDYSYDSYKTSDMSILAPHLTANSSVVDWTYQQTPSSIIWCIKDNGDMIGLTYQRQHKVVAWHNHNTDGEFLNIASIPGRVSREDDVWLTVRRYVNGSWRYYLEKLAPEFRGTTANEGRFLDSYTVVDNSVTQASFLNGYTYLEGKTVSILADGTVHAPVLVQAGGYIPLDDVYDEIVFGLPYYSEVRPLLSELSLKDGTSKGRTQRITSLAIDFYRTLGIYIGRTSQEDSTQYDHEEEISFRLPQHNMGEPVPLFTGIHTHDFPEGFDVTSNYYIRQKQPLPFTVRGVVDSVEVYD